MNLTIELPEDQTAALAAKAKARGLSPEDYAREVLQNDLAPEWLQESWKSSRATGIDRMPAEEIDAEIAAARKTKRDSQPQPGS